MPDFFLLDFILQRIDDDLYPGNRQLKIVQGLCIFLGIIFKRPYTPLKNIVVCVNF